MRNNPKIIKIVVNMGIGNLARDKDSLNKASQELAQITGQKPAVRNARISVAGFNLRKGMPVGLMITMRGKKAYNFLTKVAKIVLPRLRDFKGVRKIGFDASGNYTLGIADYSVFPEVDVAKSDKQKGLEITIVNDAGNPEKAKALLESLGVPFEK
ncbi:50S ribosomal protein L5 [Candidatus Woesebacteria bacterium RIFCSPHIGHO2_02_FULL_38_9]|uniref:Large ribosomal subunit protein uL5 n=1 Tax=Candidatus Woesebacteria bacterium RIFCSPHIGHO2_01_FULL_39_28 TaxID=1802496 RepID=A0A1F7YCE8_9BACT|nr:MAG: 50S ribosomal protein L5 [Candidatus Woesebacteria bacterium RIFCSPHIGHO2_01_FULL_39_28]OGM32240.1 MAG: 50S ribosomal protein L5 [Candidatus Woesebacteria bacterium RIFCSPHIGHO2_02_FULL_38_9]OGM58463.1 MAG: 50S ribosomal protein L5 [Candidatus Woesebacteria bacterium RIFCSPLOWO2_01_FULL_38_20]